MKKWLKRFLVGGVALGITAWLTVLIAYAATYTGTLDEDGEATPWVYLVPKDSTTFSLEPDDTTTGFIGTTYTEWSKDGGYTHKRDATITGAAGAGLTSTQSGTWYNDNRYPIWYRARIENIDDDNTSAAWDYTLTEVDSVMDYVELKDGVIELRNGTDLMRFTEAGVEIPTISGTSTYSGTSTFSGATTFSGAVTTSSTVTHSGAVTFDSTMILDQGTNPSQTAEGSVFWDTDDDNLTIGNASGRETLVTTDNTQTLTNKTIAYTREAYITSGAKVGATDGWTVGAATDLAMLASLPASQTDSTLIVPLTGLELDDTVLGVNLIGQVEADAGTVVLDVDVRKMTAAAADITDASLDTLGSTNIYGDATLTITNTEIDLSTADTVADGETFYLIITATTPLGTDIQLQGCRVDYTHNLTP